MKLSVASTLLEAVKESLANAGRFNAGDAVAPVAILWPDAQSEWQSLISRLRTLLPELLTLGMYDPEKKTGPAIWMRCAIEGTLPELKLPEKTMPILYLPNVSRQL